MSQPAKPEINLALAAIIRDIQAVAKDRRNESQGFKFRGIDDVYNALHPIFSAHGVVCIPFVESMNHDRFQNAKGNNVFHSFVTMGFRFTASDGSSVEARTVGEGMDFGDKATAKALSVAHKYLLLQTFLIPTADIAEGDYDSTIDPREEIEDLKRRREEEAKRIVMEGGDNIELSPEDIEKLAKKRADAAKSVKDSDAAALKAQSPAASAPPASKEKKGKATPPVETPAPAAQTPAPKSEDSSTPPWKDDGKPIPPEVFCSYVISQITIPEFQGKRLDQLSASQIVTLKTSWCDKHAEKISKNPAKVKESAMIVSAFNFLPEDLRK